MFQLITKEVDIAIMQKAIELTVADLAFQMAVSI